MKTIVITGASKGIGFALAQAYAQANYTVIALDIQQPQYHPSNINFFTCDIGDFESIKQVFSTIYKTFGSLDILVNNAAVSYFCKPLIDVEIEEIDRLFDVNIKGTILCTKYFLEYHDQNSSGRIVNIASTRALQNEKDVDLYGASKGAIVSFTQSLAISLSNTNITVNSISPGWIHTNSDPLSKEDHTQHPSGRVGIPNDIVQACMFLTNEENQFVNGHNLVVDGGMTKKMIYQ